MSDKAHLESTLEKLITDYLVKHDWLQGINTNYDRNLGLDVSELFYFITKSQSEAWERLKV